MKQFINTVSDMCDCTMWVLVFLFEAAFFYVVFAYPGMITELAQYNWTLTAIPILLPALTLAAYGVPFERSETR